MPSNVMAAIAASLRGSTTTEAETAASIEKQIRLGAALSGSHSVGLQRELRSARSGLERHTYPTSGHIGSHRVRRLVAPARRVEERFEASSDAHVSRNQVVRDKMAAAKARWLKVAERTSGHRGISDQGSSARPAFT